MIKQKIIFLPVFLLLLTVTHSQPIPFVYPMEHTGAACPRPELPAIEQLPIVAPLTDPFLLSDGSRRVTQFSEWSCRRAEILAEIQHYEIGKKPAKPQNMTASFIADTLLTVTINVNGQALSIESRVTIPEGEGPFPAVIGIGRGTGSLPPEIFSDRNIATIAFDFGQVMSHTQTRDSEPINKLYPELEHIGAYSAWSWGISRIIDGLELTAKDINIDLSHIAVTGCSFAGKMALFAGALDERIALTIAQEPGGGGAAAWRVSEKLGNVETLGRTSHAWFMEDMFQFADEVPRLPYDHHELIALIAPRAVLVLGNPDYEWLAEESTYVSCRAAHEVWKTFGIGERFGFSIVDNHGHCQLPDEQHPEVQAFVDKFLQGDMSANTAIQIHPFESVNYKKWYEWWGTGLPILEEVDLSTKQFDYYELECAPHGAEWEVIHDSNASGDKYLSVQEGLNNTTAPSTGEESMVHLSVQVAQAGSYFLFARLNCPSANDDSFYLKVDDGAFETYNNLQTDGWEWVRITKTNLSEGQHRLTIAYREDGAKLDKICLSDFADGPTDDLDRAPALNDCKQ